MAGGQPVIDTLEAARQTPLFEWTFAIVIANLTVQFYRLVAQFATFLFDLFRLSYGVDLFWPLTTDDLRPYTHYFTTQNEIIYKLIESCILTITAFYGARSLLNYSTLGLVIYFLVFFIHGSLLVLGYIFVQGELTFILSRYNKSLVREVPQTNQ